MSRIMEDVKQYHCAEFISKDFDRWGAYENNITLDYYSRPDNLLIICELNHSIVV